MLYGSTSDLLDAINDEYDSRSCEETERPYNKNKDLESLYGNRRHSQCSAY